VFVYADTNNHTSNGIQYHSPITNFRHSSTNYISGKLKIRQPTAPSAKTVSKSGRHKSQFSEIQLQMDAPEFNVAPKSFTMEHEVFSSKFCICGKNVPEKNFLQEKF